MPRARLSLKTKLATALLEIYDECIPYRDAKKMSVDQIIAMFDCHHIIPVAEGGSDHPTNLSFMLRREHHELTRKYTVPRIAKNKRIARKHAAHLERMRTK
jgi:hypothetical protein